MTDVINGVPRSLLERVVRKFSARPHWDSMNQGQAIAELRKWLATAQPAAEVIETDCRSEEGVTVGLIDALIAICRPLATRDLATPATCAALEDLRSDSDALAIFLGLPPAADGERGAYGDAYQGAREDLAFWKRRALEAERKVIEQDRIIEKLGNALNDENGPTFMGEPVPQARAAQPQQAVAVTDEVRRLREALEFYANGDHLLLADPDEWDTCSGEPVNWLHDEAGTASVEDGSVAKAALSAHKTGEEEWVK